MNGELLAQSTSRFVSITELLLKERAAGCRCVSSAAAAAETHEGN